jgi:hypothetical protein
MPIPIYDDQTDWKIIDTADEPVRTSGTQVTVLRGGFADAWRDCGI